jgi:hypothetical protein
MVQLRGHLGNNASLSGRDKTSDRIVNYY